MDNNVFAHELSFVCTCIIYVTMLTHEKTLFHIPPIKWRKKTKMLINL